MKKLVIQLSALACMMISAVVGATSQFRSPISLESGFMHYPLPDLDESPWFQKLYGDCCDMDHREWYSYQWSGAYWRRACDAFFDGCNGNSSTTKTTSLSQLFFGESQFIGAQVFPGGTINNLCLTPSCASLFLGFARIQPQFTYDEKGFVWGWQAEHRCGCDYEWRIGAKVSLPFKVIEIEQNPCHLEETLNDVVGEFPLNIDAEPDPEQVDFAYHLDFLTAAVCYPATTGDNVPGTPGVFYGNGSGDEATDGRTQVLGKNVDGASASGTIMANNAYPPVYLTTSLDGTLPCQPWRRKAAQVTAALPANGAAGTPSDTILFFDQFVNYAGGLAHNQPAQAQLFVTPRRLDNVDEEFANTADIRQRVKTVLNIIESGEETAVEFFRRNGIDLCASECIKGLGNLDAEIYVGYGHYDICEWYGLLHFGMKFPTDKRQEDPKRIFFQSTGNNHHYEARVEFEGGWWPIEWFAFNADVSYNHVLRGRQFVAAPFVGATIRNIGPCVEAEVKWNYVVAHANFNFFHPCSTDLGGVISYELFAKQRDHVRLDKTTAVDFIGNTGKLDPKILEAHTRTMTHKIRGEVFYRSNFCELFVGGSQIVAGRNAMKETEAHLGVAIWF